MGVATYEDLLQNPHDEDLYEYYATSQLVSVDTATGKVTQARKAGHSGGRRHFTGWQRSPCHSGAQALLLFAPGARISERS